MSSEREQVIFKPRLIKEDDMYGTRDGYTLNLIKPNIYQFASKGAGSNVYLIIGEELNVLIDTGIISKFNSFNYLLTTEVGLKVEDINLVINTHEHFDHISSNAYFHCAIAAHRLAATKIQHTDELITKGKKWGIDLSDLKVNIWLEDGNIIDLGNVFLKIISTPGHTSGCICIYDPYKHYIFTGDTLFQGTSTSVYESGSISEYINSLQILNTLKIKSFYPGHGNWVMGTDEINKEIAYSIENAKKELQTFIDKIKSKSIEYSKPPPSLYRREEEDL